LQRISTQEKGALFDKSGVKRFTSIWWPVVPDDVRAIDGIDKLREFAGNPYPLSGYYCARLEGATNEIAEAATNCP
jgi:hypothetical protein